MNYCPVVDSGNSLPSVRLCRYKERGDDEVAAATSLEMAPGHGRENYCLFQRRASPTYAPPAAAGEFEGKYFVREARQ